MKALLGAFNQDKGLVVGAFSVCDCENRSWNRWSTTQHEFYVMCDCWLQPSEQQHCAWINRTLEIHRKCVNVHWLWGSHELRFLRWSRGVVFSPFRHRLRRSDILLSSTNSSPSIGLVENETKNFCVSDSTMHLKTPLKSPADGWGTEADFRNPFLLRSPESQYYNANVPRHLR